MDDNTNDEPTNKDIIAALEQSELTITNLRNILAKTSAQAETWRRVSESSTTMEMSAVSKVLQYKNIGRNKLFKILREENILRYNNEPYQRHLEEGHFEVIEQEEPTSYGDTLVNRKTVVTQKGIDYIRKTLDKLGYEYES